MSQDAAAQGGARQRGEDRLAVQPSPAVIDSSTTIPAEASVRAAAAADTTLAAETTAASTRTDEAASATGTMASVAAAAAAAALDRAMPDPSTMGQRGQVRLTPPSGPPNGGDPGVITLVQRRSWPMSRSGLARLRINGHTCTRAVLEQLGSSPPRSIRLPEQPPPLRTAAAAAELTPPVVAPAAPGEQYTPARPVPALRPEPEVDPAPALVAEPNDAEPAHPEPAHPAPADAEPAHPEPADAAPAPPEASGPETGSPAIPSAPADESPPAFHPAAGIQLGLDQLGRPLMIRPFQGEPSRIALVGGYWAAHLLARRALDAGGELLVVTGNPVAWQAFIDRAPGAAGRVRLIPPHPSFDITAGLRMPTLVIDDGWALGAQLPPSPQAAVMTVIPRLTPQAAAHLRVFGLVAFQRLSADEATLATSTLGLGPEHTSALQWLEPDMLALFGNGAGHYVWIAQSDDEKRQFGPPQR